MKNLALLISLIFFGLYLNAEENNCLQITESWNSEKQAIANIEQTNFIINESIKPGAKSWMTMASFYSCDETFGYLIVKSDKKTMVHQDVPMAVWKSLKNAKSLGGYYNFYIKGKYKLKVDK